MKLLLAIDDSKFSEAALRTVVEQLRPESTEVRVLHVVEPPSLLVTREMGEPNSKLAAVWKLEMKAADTLVTSTAEELRKKGFKVSTLLEQGEPRTKIVDSASAWKSDLIVVGSHGRTGLDRLLLGSVSEAVARHAHCSVEIVRIRSSR